MTQTLERWTRTQWQAEGERIGALIKAKLAAVGAEGLRVRWEWNDTFTLRMGDCKPDLDRKGARMRFSKPLWLAASPAQRDETVLHELAHAIVECVPGPRFTWDRRGRRKHQKHDRVFKSMLVRLGGTGARTHKVDRSHVRRRQVRFVAPCSGCGKVIDFSKAVKTKWIRYNQVRCCRGCGASLDSTWARTARRAS